MYKVKFLKDWNQYKKKGDIAELNDFWTLRGEKSGHLKIIKYLGKIDSSPHYKKLRIKRLKKQIAFLQHKLKMEEMK